GGAGATGDGGFGEDGRQRDDALGLLLDGDLAVGGLHRHGEAGAGLGGGGLAGGGGGVGCRAGLAAAGQEQRSQQRAREGLAYGPHERVLSHCRNRETRDKRRFTLFHEG